MGQKLSQQKILPDAQTFMRKYYPEYPYVELLNDGIMYKTVLITNDKDQSPLLLKIFYKDNYNDKDKKQFEIELEKVKELQKKILSAQYKLNIVPTINIKNTERSGIIYRQYIGISLKERMYLMPYLTNIDKIWISFQLLYLFNNLNKMQIFHGDLKPENILITSNLSVYLADFATYKPAYIYSNDLGSYTYYFGSYNSDNLKGCYLAPERLCDDKNFTGNEEKNSLMDVFSLGLIIAELFLEKNIFDFTSLLNYKKGRLKKINIEELLKGITNDKIKVLILEMLKINPNERITIDKALKIFIEEICPFVMTGFLFHLNIIINKTSFWKPDLLIGFLYRYWNTIWKLIYGPSSLPIPLFQRMNFPIINKLIADNPITTYIRNPIFKRENGIYIIDDFKLLFEPSEGKINFEYKDEDIFKKNNNEECVFIIINLLLQNMQNTKYETSNYVAMEMLKNFCVKLPDITKLQVIIPYFINNIKRTSYTTKLTSLNYIFEILYSFNFNELILPVTEYNYFDSYVFPKILKFYNPKKPYLVIEFLNNIDKIIDLELKFLNITLKSRIIRLTKIVNEETNSLLKNNNDNRIKKDEKYKEIKKKKQKRVEEIYNDYDSCLDLFKDNLFNVINDVIGSINEIDLLIITIRKLPCLLDFYGRGKSNDFSKFIINNFNKNEWIIQKEILNQIPKMMNTLGQNILDNYILPCMEVLIGSNSNEFKTYKLIGSINTLLKKEILSPNKCIKFLLDLLPYSLHPNSQIHNEILDLIKNLLNYLDSQEIFFYLQKSFEPYLKIPYFSLNFELIKNSYLRSINRCYYMLQLNNINIDLNFIEKTSDNNKLQKFPQILLIENIIEKEKRNNLMCNDNGDIIYIFKDENEDITNIKKYSLIEPLNKYIKKEAKLNNLYGEELDKKVFGKIFWLSSEKDRYKIPYIKDENFFSLEKSEERIPSELFQINYVLKTLCISIKLVKLNFLLGFNKNIQTVDNPINSNKDTSLFLGNFYYNKNFSGWRPQGRLMTTVYDHQKPIEKLIPMKNKKFCSFDSECNPIIWKIKGSNDEFILKKKWSMNLKDEYSLSYKNTINYLDNLFFIFGHKKFLYSINFISFPSTVDKLCESPDSSNITCTYLIGNKILDSQKILFTSENGSINLYDQRVNGISLTNNLNKSTGIPYCISEFFDKNFFLVGTLSGKLISYDLRINRVISEKNYNNGTPILGMLLHKQNQDVNKHLVIWSGNENYEIGLWNIDENYNISIICDLLLKVNSIDYDDENTFDPLLVDIPIINLNKDKYKNNNIINNRKNIKKNFKILNKYTYLYNTKSNRNLIHSKIKDELYFSCKKNLNNLCNIYENPTTVQCVLSPLCGENFYENTSYLLTGGNDRTIRYWDLSKDLTNEFRSKNSYIVNTPTNMTNCEYKKFKVNGTTILESNEIFNQPETKNKIIGFSDYQNYNGINYYSSEKNIKSGYSTRNLDVSHKSVVTDLLTFNLDEEYIEKPHNFLISSSWDGTIKVWK